MSLFVPVGAGRKSLQGTFPVTVRRTTCAAIRRKSSLANAGAGSRSHGVQNTGIDALNACLGT